MISSDKWSKLLCLFKQWFQCFLFNSQNINTLQTPQQQSHIKQQQLDKLIFCSFKGAVVYCKCWAHVLFRFYDPNKGRKCSSCSWCVVASPMVKGTLNTQPYWTKNSALQHLKGQTATQSFPLTLVDPKVIWNIIHNAPLHTYFKNNAKYRWKSWAQYLYCD